MKRIHHQPGSVAEEPDSDPPRRHARKSELENMSNVTPNFPGWAPKLSRHPMMSTIVTLRMSCVLGHSIERTW